MRYMRNESKRADLVEQVPDIHKIFTRIIPATVNKALLLVSTGQL